MTRYCVGFWFSEELGHVVLILKDRPVWQAGKYNGVGGKVEDGELVYRAMVREFAEETGVKTKVTDWRHVAVLQDDTRDHTLTVFTGRGDVTVSTQETEPVTFYNLDALHRLPLVPAVAWLVPLCRYVLEGRGEAERAAVFLS